MDDLVAPHRELEMGDVERPDGLQRQLERRLAPLAVIGPQLLPHLPQRAQYPCTIETLSFAMFAVAHLATMISRSRGAGAVASSDPHAGAVDDLPAATPLLEQVVNALPETIPDDTLDDDQRLHEVVGEPGAREPDISGGIDQ